MFNPSRDQVRRFFIDAWHKRRHTLPETPLETMAADIATHHPEYHALVADPASLDREFSPEDGQINPFLHLSLHLAIEEQLSIDQPPGLRAAFDALCTQLGERHAALHAVLECLGETLYEAQANRREPDGAAYVDRVRARCLHTR